MNNPTPAETLITPELQPIVDFTWQKISLLADSLARQDPLIAGHLAAIHQNLNKYEELNHLLSDEQIREIVVAQKQVTGTVLVTKVVKSGNASIMKQAKALSKSDNLSEEL